MHRILIIAKNKNFPKRIGDRQSFSIHPAIEQRMEANMSSPKAQDSINGHTFFPVPEFSDVECVWGAEKDRYFDRRNIPDVPRAFEDAASDFFFNGGKAP